MVTLGSSVAVRTVLATTALPRSEAVVLASMYAFFPYMALPTWDPADKSLLRLCWVMTVVGVASWSGSLSVA